jgi:hypothetical protein
VRAKLSEKRDSLPRADPSGSRRRGNFFKYWSPIFFEFRITPRGALSAASPWALGLRPRRWVNFVFLILVCYIVGPTCQLRREQWIWALGEGSIFLFWPGTLWGPLCSFAESLGSGLSAKGFFNTPLLTHDTHTQNTTTHTAPPHSPPRRPHLAPPPPVNYLP